MTEPVHVRSAVEREGGIPWVDTYLESESAITQPFDPRLLMLPTAAPRPNRAERRDAARAREQRNRLRQQGRKAQ